MTIERKSSPVQLAEPLQVPAVRAARAFRWSRWSPQIALIPAVAVTAYVSSRDRARAF